MSIVDVRAIPLAIPARPMTPLSPWQGAIGKQVVVRVVTKEGPVGVGEAFGVVLRHGGCEG